MSLSTENSSAEQKKKVDQRDIKTSHQTKSQDGMEQSLGSKVQKKSSRRCCKIAKRFLVVCMLLLVLLGGALGGALYYFLGTTNGARKALDLAQSFIPQSIIVDTTIEEGTIFDGLTLGKTYVEIEDVMVLTADDLVLKYDLWQLKNKLFDVSILKSDSLSVILNDKLFEPKAKEEEPSTEPFKLVFPIDIAINKFNVNNFSFVSKIVDVDLGLLDTTLSAKADLVKIDNTNVDTIVVHLKSDKAQPVDNSNLALDKAEQELMASINDQSGNSQDSKDKNSGISVQINGKEHKVHDLDETVNAVLAAVEESNQATANQETNDPEQKVKVQVYSDQELRDFADAIEFALLNNQPVPVLAQSAVNIHNPNLSEQYANFPQYVNALTDTNVVSADYSNADAIELANVARQHRSQKELDLEARKQNNLVREFGDAGIIQPLAKVVLPFDVDVSNFKAKKIRYYMDGFDTKEIDLVLDASWQDSKLVAKNLEVNHSMGEVKLSGTMDFEQFYNLDIKLDAIGYETPENKTLLEGLFYGLSANLDVKGNLTDLRVKSSLTLGGSSTLDLHANVLSSALPMEVTLKTREISYPIFGEPLVDLKAIDLHSIGNLLDGVDVSLNANVSGFDFKNVSTILKAQVSYEKSHIDLFEVKGKYKKEPLEAKVSGDFFYGDLLGADAKVYAKVIDAGFIHKSLKGPLQVDADLVAMLDQNQYEKTALSVASEPRYIKERIPKVSVSEEDFNPDRLEAELLSLASPVSNSKAVNSSFVAIDSTLQGFNSVQTESAEEKEAERILASNYEVKDKSEIKSLEQEIHAPKATVHKQNVQETKQARAQAQVLKDQAQKAKEVKLAYLPLQSDKLTPKEYEQALKANIDDNPNLDNETNTSIFNQSLPKVKTNIRKIKASLFLNGQETFVDIDNIVGDLQKGFRVKLLSVKSGKNSILAKGQITEKIANLNAVVDFGDLNSLVPGLTGSFTAKVATIGSIRDLNFEVSGNAPKLKYGDIVIAKLIFDTAYNMQTQAINLTALSQRLRVTKALPANRQCFIDIAGTPLHHNISFNCGGVNTAYFSIDGSVNYAKTIYIANLMELYVSSEQAGSISLLTPVLANINYGAGEGNISPVELKGDTATILLSETKFAKGYVKTDLSVTNFNLQNLKDFMPSSSHMAGPVNIEANILIENNLPDIKASVSSTKGYFYDEFGAGIAYDTLSLNTRITHKLMHTEFDLSLLKGRGHATSVVDIHDPLNKGILSGYFKLKDFDLRTISNIGQSFNELKGFTNIDVKFDGSLSKPLVLGTVSIKGSAIPRYDVGQINDFNFNFESKGQHGDIDGVVKLNGVDLKIGGNLDWSNGANGSIVAQAENLPVFLVGYGTARANLDTTVTLGDILKVNGKLHIPQAQIAVNDVSSSGVGVSSDEILVPETGTSTLLQQKSNPLKSVIDFDVTFGDKVNFSALGLVEGRIIGGLHIKKNVDNNSILGNGELNVADGTADLYGRKLNFANARILFRDDIANPALDIEIIADRDYIEDDVEVGVKVTGTAKSPDINLFSKPTLSQNEILSYLMYGHGLDKNTAMQDSNNSNLLLGLGVSSVSGLVSALTNSFGVKNIQVGTQGNGDDMQVSVQGYITNRLRISYGYGIFNTIGEFKIRYELMRRLYVEFASSIDQAVDLVYTFDF